MQYYPHSLVKLDCVYLCEYFQPSYILGKKYATGFGCAQTQSYH